MGSQAIAGDFECIIQTIKTWAELLPRVDGEAVTATHSSSNLTIISAPPRLNLETMVQPVALRNNRHVIPSPPSLSSGRLLPHTQSVEPTILSGHESSTYASVSSPHFEIEAPRPFGVDSIMSDRSRPGQIRPGPAQYQDEMNVGVSNVHLASTMSFGLLCSWNSFMPNSNVHPSGHFDRLAHNSVPGNEKQARLMFGPDSVIPSNGYSYTTQGDLINGDSLDRPDLSQAFSSGLRDRAGVRFLSKGDADRLPSARENQLGARQTYENEQ